MLRLIALFVVWLWSGLASASSVWEYASFPGGVVLGDAADAATVRRLAEHAATSMPRIAGELGVPTVEEVRVTLAPSELSFRDLQPGRPPAWADGKAWPEQGLIYLKSPRIRYGTATPLETVLDHELIHVLLGRAFGDRPVPSWLQEGVAKVLAREYTPAMTDALAGAVLGGNLLSLDELTGNFPAEPLRAQLAYAQSADMIAFLRNRWGEDALRVLVRRMAAGASVEESVRAATGLGPVALEAAWRARLLASPIWLRALVRPELWMGLGGLAFLIGAGLRSRRNRKKLERWVEQEALETAVMQALLARRALTSPLALGPGAALAPTGALVLAGSRWRTPAEDEPVN